ncbi:MAG: S26 family signal peptidase, partial [Gaiellaceae bacterium]
MTEQRPPSDVEPVRWEDEDALFSAPTGDGSAEGWPGDLGQAETAEERLERERRERARRSRNPVVRATAGLPRSLRVTIDWAVTIIGAVAIVLAIKAWVVNPYRIPSSSMEPTLHCARPGSGCESR